MPTTQDDRILKIFTPLGKDFLLLDSMSAAEGISELFKIDVRLLHEEDAEGYLPTIVDPKSILGNGITISVRQSDDTVRLFHGMVKSFSQGTRHARFSFYSAEIVPHVWLLTQKSQSRIFQNMSVPDIIREVLTGFDYRIEVQDVNEKRNYCVQYRETDWDFVCRLMEEEGIFYYFEHSEEAHKLVIANSPQSHKDCPNKSTIEYFHKVADEDKVGSILSWMTDDQILTGKVSLADHNFQQPLSKFDAQVPSRFTIGGNQNLELYDHPGGYARKFDGIDSSGSEQPGELSKIHTDKDRIAKNLMEFFDVRYQVSRGTSDCPSLTPGHRFEMINHPNSDLNKSYVVTSIRHEGNQSPSYVSDSPAGEPYMSSFTAIGQGAGKPTFRPAMTTPKPIVHGSQTAIVVGPPGEEIFVDKYGRVKVQFHWDRKGNYDAGSSCWVRVAQGWAGRKWGMVFTPRIGMEVIVHFLEGDPDRPIITGCVYNPETMPPYTLPDEKTKSTIKSNASKGGGGFNEFRIEDKKGSEQIFIHAEKDKEIRVKNDCKELIKHDRHLIVENDQYEEVKKDKHLTVKGDQNEKISGTISVESGADIHQKAANNTAMEAGMGVHIKAGMSVTVEAGTSLTLKVGGNFININPGGIFIKGAMVMLNSGGAAGSGSGCSPNPPKIAKEAVDAHAGEVRGQKPSAVRPPVAQFSPLALSFAAAARNACPFVDT